MPTDPSTPTVESSSTAAREPGAVDTEAWLELDALLEAGRDDDALQFVYDLAPQDTGYTLSHLEESRRTGLMSLLSERDPDFASTLLGHVDDQIAADIVSELEPVEAAAIVDEMESDEQVDVLAELDESEAEAILEAMSPEEAQDVRQRLVYDENTAGGLMITEFLSFPEDMDVKRVRQKLRKESDRVNSFEVRYLYTVDHAGGLLGVTPMRDLLLAKPGVPLSKPTIAEPMVVTVHTPLEELEDLFDRVDFSALPVVDDDAKLVGVVQRAAVQEALSEGAQEDLAKFGGIVGGEELRSMPTLGRAARRLMFLLPIMVLLLVSATIIAKFEETIQRLPILAALLPVVAGLCGSGGNQAVAVSMREISLGLIEPKDFMRVFIKEAAVALLAGVVLAVSLAAVVWVWRGQAELGMVVGASVVMVILLSKIVGGTVPLVLRHIGIDPAMASGPIVTTVVDLTSFFTVLLLAEMALG